MNNNCKEIRVLTEILQVKDLTITEKMILSQIDALDQKEGCFASNNYFAELFLLSKTQISKIISDLKKKGWISVKYVNKKNTKAIEKRDYSNIDLSQKILFVNRTTTIGKNGETIIGNSTKTYAGKRSIPIPDFMISIFKKQIEISKNNKENFLFLNDDKLITNSACNSRLKRILLDKLGWENTGISTHSLRHTFATRCIESGVNAVVLQRLLGHTDISITLNTYTSVFNLFKDIEKFQNGTEDIYID